MDQRSSLRNHHCCCALARQVPRPSWELGNLTYCSLDILYLIVRECKQNGGGGKRKSREGRLILDNVIGFWEYDDHMNHDDDDAGINVPNDIETLMMLMIPIIPIVIITMMVKRWRKKGQLFKSRQRQRRQR